MKIVCKIRNTIATKLILHATTMLEDANNIYTTYPDMNGSLVWAIADVHIAWAEFYIEVAKSIACGNA